MSSKTPWTTALLYFWAFLSSAYMSGFHPLTVLFLPLAAVVYALRGRLPGNRWVIGLGSIGAVIVAGGVWQSTKDSGYLLGVGSIALAVFLSIELLLFTLLRPTQSTRMAVPGLSGAVLITCTMSLEIEPVAMVAGVSIVLLSLALRERAGLRLGLMRLLLPLTAMLTLGFTLATAAKWSETQLAYYLNLFAVIPASGIRFPPTSTLSSLQQWGGSDIVVLRVYGDDPPPYLVGRTFTNFDERQSWVWKPTKKEVTPTETLVVSNGQQLPYYANWPNSTKPRGSSVLVEFPDGGSGFTFYTPRYFAGFATDLPQLHQYSDGMWQVLTRDSFSGFYWLFPYQDGWKSPGPPEVLSEAERQKCLELPANLTPEVALQAQKVAGAYSDHDEKARRITAYFQTQFTYGYDYPFESTQTALEEFLQKRPPAHCEFFATASALMLRSQGVPTRYINGFVVQERSFNDEYFVIRLKHAHAWVEAYLPDQGWVTFDPTPPGTLDDPNTKGPFFSAALEWFSNRWRQLLAWFRLSPADMLDSIKRTLTHLTPLQWVGLFGMVLSLWGLKRWWLARRNRPKPSRSTTFTFVAGRHERLTPALESLQQAVTPPEWRRRASETPDEWLTRLRLSTLDRDLADRLGQALADYQAARYGAPRNAAQLENLEEELSRLRRAFEGKSLEAREARPH